MRSEGGSHATGGADGSQYHALPLFSNIGPPGILRGPRCATLTRSGTNGGVAI